MDERTYRATFQDLLQAHGRHCNPGRASKRRHTTDRGQRPSFSLEALEARVLLNADLAGAAQVQVVEPVPAEPAPVLLSQDTAAPTGSAAPETLLGVFGQTPGADLPVVLALKTEEGTDVSFHLHGAGTGEVRQTDQGWNLELTGTDPGSAVMVFTERGSQGISLQHITADGSLGVLNAPTTTLLGTATIQGSVGSLALNDLAGGTITASSIQGLTILGDIEQGTLRIGTEGGQDGGGAENSGFLTALYVRGSVTGTTVHVGAVDGNADTSGIRYIRIDGALSADSQFIGPAFPETIQVGGTRTSVAGDPRFSAAVPESDRTPPVLTESLAFTEEAETLQTTAVEGGATTAPAAMLTDPVTLSLTLAAVPLVGQEPEPSIETVVAAPVSNPAPVHSQWASTIAQWEAQMLEHGRRHGQAMMNMPGSTVTERVDMTYYDGQAVYYQIADYTGDQSWLTYARVAEGYYRDQFVMPRQGAVPGFWNFTRGLRMDYERTGDAVSREAVMLLSRHATYAPSITPLAWSASTVQSREVAYAIMSYVNAEALGSAPIARKTDLIDQAIGHIDQWFVSRTAPYISPFMVGLTMQALMQAHEQAPDPRIQAAITTAANGLWQHAWIPSQSAFYYVSTNAAQAAPDLNMIIAPAYGWLYRHTGDVTFRDRGDQIFTGAVKQAYLGHPKQFNQNYLWSFDYLAWRG